MKKPDIPSQEGFKVTSFAESIRHIYSVFEKLDFSQKDSERSKVFLREIKMTAEKNYGFSEVPGSFVVRNRSSIIFLPVGLKGSPGLNPINYADGRVEDTNEKKRLRKAYFDHRFDTKLILNIKDLEQVLNWCETEVNEENIHLMSSMYYRAVFAYFQNIELYKLTKDPDATIYRYAESDWEEEIPHVERKKYGGWIAPMNETMLKKAEYKVVTHWFRKDQSLDCNKGYLGKTHVRRSTIGSVKRTHFIALDSAEDAAIVLINKS